MFENKIISDFIKKHIRPIQHLQLTERNNQARSIFISYKMSARRFAISVWMTIGVYYSEPPNAIYRPSG